MSRDGSTLRPTKNTDPAERVVAFYNERGTRAKWIKEGKGAIKWTRLSCRTFAADARSSSSMGRHTISATCYARWDARADQRLVAGDEGEADQHRCESRQSRPLRCVPDRRDHYLRRMFQEILRLIAKVRPQPRLCQRKASMVMRFKGARREECGQMPRKIARSAAQRPFALPKVPPTASRPAVLPKRQQSPETYASSSVIRGYWLVSGRPCPVSSVAISPRKRTA